jgi:hypothetical protein
MISHGKSMRERGGREGREWRERRRREKRSVTWQEKNQEGKRRKLSSLCNNLLSW